jgi:hypothetical protein
MTVTISKSIFRSGLQFSPLNRNLFAIRAPDAAKLAMFTTGHGVGFLSGTSWPRGRAVPSAGAASLGDHHNHGLMARITAFEIASYTYLGRWIGRSLEVERRVI